MLTKMAAFRITLLTTIIVSVIRPSKVQALSVPALDPESLPNTNFSCIGKVIGGYYADVYTGCQMFHVCTLDEKGEIHDYKFGCIPGTVFDQETRVCERADEVDCSISESFFYLNNELYGPGIIPPTAVSADAAMIGPDLQTTTTQPAFVFPVTSFSCNDKVSGGLYADTETGCAVFHICSVGPDSSIIDNKFVCGNGTLFDQKSRTCQTASAVDCSQAESLFYLNDRLKGPGNMMNLCLIQPLGTPLADLTTGCRNYSVCTNMSDGAVVENHYSCKKGHLFSQLRKLCLPQRKVKCIKETLSEILSLSSSKNEKHSKKSRVTRSLVLHRLRLTAVPPLANALTNAGMEDAHVQRALFSLAALQHWASENAHDTTFIDMYSLNTKDSDYPKKGFNNIGHSTRYGYILRKKRSANNNQTSLPAPSDHMSNSNVVSNTSSSSIIPSPTRITPTLSTVTISTVPLAISTVPLTTTVTLPPSTVTVTNTVTVGVFSNTALPSSQEVPLAMTSTTVTPLDLVRNDSKATEELVQPSISVTEVSTNSSVTPSLLPLEVSSSTNNASVANTVSLQNQTAVESNLETSTSGNKTSNDTIPITSTLATVLQSNVAVTEPSVKYDNSTASSNNITAISNETALNTSIPFTTLPPGDKVTEPYVESDNFTLLSNVTTTTISSSPNVIPPEGSINASTTVVPNNSESSANSTAPIGTQAPAPTTGPFTRDNLPETNFTCKDKKLEQFYPDTEANCQVFHYCSPGFDDNQILDLKFLCTGATMFDVKTQKCENMTNVTCGEPPIDIVEVNTVATDIIPIIENTTNQTAALTPAGIDTTITTTTAEPITEVTPTEIPDIPVIREETSTPSDIEAPSTTELGAIAETHTDLIDTPIEVEEFVADQSEPITDLPIELSTSAVPHPDSITQINSLSDVFTSPNDTDVSEQVSKHSSITDSENTNIETP